MKNKTPAFDWKDGRAAGVFLHISSLPSEFGAGNVGAASEAFFDFLEAAGMSWWQICPLGPTGYGDSPYQTFSSFAGNAYFIDFAQLSGAGLLNDSDLAPLRALDKNRCDYGALYALVPEVLRKAAENWQSGSRGNFGEFSETFEGFCEKNAEWLDDYSLFAALKKLNGGKAWTRWDAPLRDREPRALAFAKEQCAGEIFRVKFAQWVFFGQYEKFRESARSRGIKIFGDLPIYAAGDSADVWANREVFELYPDGSPKNVAGVGPDYFCAEGQLWGNPLYDWKGAKEKVYEFWKRRIGAAAAMYDAVRFDHFRGFADYWSIPAKSGDARKGHWKIGAGLDFFKFVKANFPDTRFVAEDLGLLSKRAENLRDILKIPSMAVLQFAFGDGAKNPYYPHNVGRGRVYYTGTHDNDTSVGWYASADEPSRDRFRRYFRTTGENPSWDMIHAVMKSCADLAVIPMQDILGLGSDCRFNTPGKPDGNWAWRMSEDQLSRASRENAPYLKSFAELVGRLPPEPENLMLKK